MNEIFMNLLAVGFFVFLVCILGHGWVNSNTSRAIANMIESGELEHEYLGKGTLKQLLIKNGNWSFVFTAIAAFYFFIVGAFITYQTSVEPIQARSDMALSSTEALWASILTCGMGFIILVYLMWKTHSGYKKLEYKTPYPLRKTH